MPLFAKWTKHNSARQMIKFTFPTRRGNTISPVAELTIKILAIEPESENDKETLETRAGNKNRKQEPQTSAISSKLALQARSRGVGEGEGVNA